VLSLPLHPAMSNDDVNDVATALLAFRPATGRTACVR
jgi:dTDP-4-amino-4,6-dideoxygalactose transaminase